MAEHRNIDAGPSPGVPVAVDVDGQGDEWQRIKVGYGPDGSPADVTTANPLPVVQTGTPALPTGAATATNQASEIAALGAIADAAYVSGSGSIVAILKGLFAKLPALVSGRVPVDGSGVTQPVSGTVTANAGSGTLAVSGPVTDTQLRATPVPVSGTVTATPTGTQAVSHAAATQADGHSANIGLLADASSANTLTGLLKAIKAAITGTLTISGTVTTTPPANASTNLAQVAGATTATGHGTASGALRVELPTDGTGIVGLAPGTNAIGKLAANSGVDIGDVDVTSSALPTGAATSALQSAEATLIGAVNETAPATDTANSGLNGRVQRACQRITTLIGLLPASIGQKAMAGSLSVVVASDQEVAVIVNDIPLAPDAASETTLSSIQTVLPTALGANGGLKIEGVASGTVVPVSDGGGSLTVDGTVTTTPPSNASSNVAQINGVTPLMGAGISGTGAQRVTPSIAATGAAPTAFTATTSTQIFASNAARRLFTVYNNSDKDLYLMMASAAVSVTSYHVKVAAGGFFSTSDYSGEIRGIMSATIGSGQVNPGEFT